MRAAPESHPSPFARERPAVRVAGRRFAVCAAAFLAAAAAVAIAQAVAPFERGWWLVAYLALVGALSQALLGPGLIALAERARAPRPAIGRAPLALYNGGAAVVAVANLAALPAGVVAGSVALLAALMLFARALGMVRAGARAPVAGWPRAYALLVAFLAVSVVVGTVLAFGSHS